MTKTYFWKKNQ